MLLICSWVAYYLSSLNTPWDSKAWFLSNEALLWVQVPAHSYLTQLLHHSTLVCSEWSSGMPWELGVIVATEGCEPHSVAWCALTTVNKLKMFLVSVPWDRKDWKSLIRHSKQVGVWALGTNYVVIGAFNVISAKGKLKSYGQQNNIWISRELAAIMMIMIM